MVHGMDDQDDPNNRLALEAMSSLSKILDHLEQRDARSTLLHVAIRIRPFFDSVRIPAPIPGIWEWGWDGLGSSPPIPNFHPLGWDFFGILGRAPVLG